MLTLNENKSKTWFKVLSEDGTPIDGSLEDWSLPFAHNKGDVLDFTKSRAYWLFGNAWSMLDRLQGTWIINDPRLAYEFNKGHRVFIVELLDPPIEETPGVIWAGRLRLVREAVDLDLRRYGIHRALGQII